MHEGGEEDAPSLPQRLERRLADLAKLAEETVLGDLSSIAFYVDKLRHQNPGISDDDLARLIVRRNAVKNALVRAVTGVPGFALAPLTVSSDLALSWRIQGRMVLAIAHVYGYTENTDAMDLRTDIYILLAGNTAKEALRQFGIQASMELTRKTVDQYVTRQMMQRIWRVLGQSIITKAGAKSLTSFMKLVPLVGAIPGAGIDWVSARVVGRQSIKYYSGKG